MSETLPDTASSTVKAMQALRMKLLAEVIETDRLKQVIVSKDKDIEALGKYCQAVAIKMQQIE